MTLGIIALLIAFVVCISSIGTCSLCLDRAAIRRTTAEFESRLREIGPYLSVTALFFVAKQTTHGISLRISYVLDWDITAEIYAVEGQFVAYVQDVVPEATLGFFSAMYMFGFPYLLATAPVLYFLLPSQRRLKELLVAYLLNYLVGSICYTLFIAYGPRNHLSSVGGLMYDAYPETQEITAAVSAGTNVFPSLHTSLSIVVLLFAWRTRREYPRWFPIASFAVSSVVFSTMYLGIHWLLDVVAGVLLGVWAVYTAERLVGRVEDDAGYAPTSGESEESIASDTEIGD